MENERFTKPVFAVGSFSYTDANDNASAYYIKTI